LPKSKIPLAFAITGLVIGFAFMAGYFYDLHYNPFHFPTWEQQRNLGGYSPPPLHTFLERLMFTLVPGLLLFVFFIGIDGWPAIVMWVFFVLLNGPIYYGIGLVMIWVLKSNRFKRKVVS
jgi:hypothetical protein